MNGSGMPSLPVAVLFSLGSLAGVAMAAPAGESVFQSACIACHGVDGQGQFPEAPLVPDSTGRLGAPPHNETGHTWHHSDVLLVRYVTEGGFSDPTRFYTMPPFGDILTDEQILQVVAYIKTMWTDEQRASQRQLTEEEQTMFSD